MLPDMWFYRCTPSLIKTIFALCGFKCGLEINLSFFVYLIFYKGVTVQNILFYCLNNLKTIERTNGKTKFTKIAGIQTYNMLFG